MSQPAPMHHRGACHCGTVVFNVVLLDGFNTARRCNCSYCRMRGAVAVSANAGDLHIIEGQAALTLYQFNTGQAQHYFCARCGVYTHHQRRSSPSQLGINVACLDGVSPFDFSEVPVFDGVNHPADNQGGPVVAGTLNYKTAGARRGQDHS